MKLLLLVTALLLARGTAQGQALPGQILRDPDHPQWLMRAGGEHVFLCGPGDPEDFFYRGERLLDGTRNGDQDALIAKLAAEGGNTLYVEVVRSHGGDGNSSHNPFVDSDPALGLDEDILVQWEGWLDQAVAADITVMFFIYDDSAKIWENAAGVVPAEQAFLEAIMNRFESYPNLIFFVSEESEEARTDAIARDLAQIMADADDHDHLIGNHHHTGTQFKSWQPGSAFEVFAVHDNVLGDQIHIDSALIHNNATTKGSFNGQPGNAYMAIMSEALFTQNGTSEERRHYIWDSAMGGLQSVVFGMDIASTPLEEHEAAQRLIDFMQTGPFWELSPADERIAGVTRWALGSDEVPAIAYTREALGQLGLTDMSAGTVDLHWLDILSGDTAEVRRVEVSAGTNLFRRPAGFGAEVAVWVQRAWDDLGHALPGSSGMPRLTGDGTLVPGTTTTLAWSHTPGPTLGVLVIGASQLGAPFKQGVMVPAFDWPINVSINATGSGALTAPWPMGAPSGLPVFTQLWFPDVGAPVGYGATNAVSEVTP
ncbi:MAG: hypothetical protein DHS20C15_15740 [Planctomycetota bacterium]|nr:MAG: hypothetical protein DHS20C15_15740 [Planctomycetota bacterium]